MPTLLLFGGTGRSGCVLARAARERGWSVTTPAHADCPLEDAARVSDLVLQARADLVINAAAVSGLETCADDALRAHLINAVAPAAMALACRHTGSRFIHLSTDYVLDGRKPGLKDETYHCKPLSVYGESKREGELQVLEALPQALIARVSWICGNPQKPAFVEQTLTKALEGMPLAAIADKDCLPTDAEDIARALLALAATGERGVLHLTSCGPPSSWRDCAVLALEEAVRVGALAAAPPVEAQQLKNAVFFREPRPQHTAMDNGRLLSLGISMPTGAQTVAAVTRRWLSAR